MSNGQFTKIWWADLFSLIRERFLDGEPSFPTFDIIDNVRTISYGLFAVGALLMMIPAFAKDFAAYWPWIVGALGFAWWWGLCAYRALVRVAVGLQRPLLRREIAWAACPLAFGALWLEVYSALNEQVAAALIFGIEGRTASAMTCAVMLIPTWLVLRWLATRFARLVLSR